jgi:hypothetical protein
MGTRGPESVWQVWADFQNAASWNEGIESIELRGPFASGTEFSMKPVGRGPRSPGAGADDLGPNLGPGVTAAFPDAVAKLVELARRRESGG